MKHPDPQETAETFLNSVLLALERTDWPNWRSGELSLAIVALVQAQMIDELPKSMVDDPISRARVSAAFKLLAEC